MRPFLALCLLSLSPSDRGLLHHWRLTAPQFEGGAFVDLAGERPLRLAQDPSFAGTAPNQGLVLNQESSVMIADFAMPAAALPSKALTAEAWVRVDEPSEWAGFIGAIEDKGEHERGFLLGLRKDRFTFGIATEGTGKLKYVTAPSAYARGRWYHVAGCYDGSVARLYINGQEVIADEEPEGAPIYDDLHQLVVGAYKDSDEEYKLRGALAEVRLYERAVNPKDLAKRAKNDREQIPVPPPDEVNVDRKLGALQIKINDAIDAGVDYILSRQHRDGSWSGHQDAYRNGQTALSAYTLVKSGVPTGSPAVQRALDYLRMRPPTKTYSAGCQLLLLSSLKDESVLEWAEQIHDDLISWESSNLRGAYGYPGGAVDLSNTQYALLGLWAGHKMGLRAPKELWQRLVATTIERHSGETEEYPWLDPGKSGKRLATGFNYRPGNGGNHRTSGSMTAAGLAVMALAEEVWGKKLGARYLRPIQTAKPRALAWLGQHWAIDQNPAVGGKPYYYLYGLERVGAFLRTEVIDGHEWYREGAEFLVKNQRGEGTWGGTEEDTCFGLLFLVRATGPSSGANAKRRLRVWDVKDGSVRLRVTGDLRLTMWVTGFDPKLLEAHKEYDDERAGLHVAKVEYLVDGEVVAESRGDLSKAWTDQRFASRWTAPREGEYEVSARVHVVPVNEFPDSPTRLETVDSKKVKVPAQRKPEDLLRQSALLYDEPNLLDSAELSTRASSSHNDKSGAERAADGRHATSWLAAKDDPRPTLVIQFDRPVRATSLLLSSPNSALYLAGQYDAPLAVEVTLNGKKPKRYELSEDDLVPNLIEFDKRTTLRSIAITIVERRAGTAGVTGFAEIGLRE